MITIRKKDYADHRLGQDYFYYTITINGTTHHMHMTEQCALELRQELDRMQVQLQDRVLKSSNDVYLPSPPKQD